MFILKNAYISITRNKGRNILISIIILLVASASTIALAIKNTALDLTKSYENAYDKEVTIRFDRTSMMKDFNMGDKDAREQAKDAFHNMSSYTIDDVKKYAQVQHIEGYYYTYQIGLNGNNIEKATSEKETFDQGEKERKQMESLDFSLNGYNSIDSMREFINGSYTIKEITEDAWDIAFKGNYVFVNEELATYNEIHLNDKIVLEDEDKNTYEFEVIGIYTEQESEGNTMSMFSNSVNTIITNADVLVDITNKNENVKGTVEPTFIIDDYKYVEAVQKSFYALGLDEKYVLETNEEEALSAISGVSNVNGFATTFLIITLIIGGSVLFIINMINIRERKYEIGVLRTIGISKLKLTLQFISELMMVAIIALILGCGIGATMSKNVSNTLLKEELERTTKQTEQIENHFGGNENHMPGDMMNHQNGKGSHIKGIVTVQAYDEINAVVDMKVLLELLVVGIALIFISSLAAMISIQRFSPLTILKERS